MFARMDGAPSSAQSRSTAGVHRGRTRVRQQRASAACGATGGVAAGVEPLLSMAWNEKTKSPGNNLIRLKLSCVICYKYYLWGRGEKNVKIFFGTLIPKILRSRISWEIPRSGCGESLFFKPHIIRHSEGRPVPLFLIEKKQMKMTRINSGKKNQMRVAPKMFSPHFR